MIDVITKVLNTLGIIFLVLLILIFLYGCTVEYRDNYFEIRGLIKIVKDWFGW